MGENYNTGTCAIRVGRDYVCLNFGSNLAASASVRDRGTSDRVPGGRACSVTVPNTNRMVDRLPRSFSGRAASINVLHTDVVTVRPDARVVEVAETLLASGLVLGRRLHRQVCGLLAFEDTINVARPRASAVRSNRHGPKK